MSILAVVDHWVKEGELFKLIPTMPDEPTERALYVSEEIWRLVVGPWNDESTARRCGRLRADMEQFVTGRIVALCLTPYEAKTALFGLLDAPADGIWDLRSADPAPGIRLLGAFAATDVFIALTAAPRSVPAPFLDREPLGEADSQQWAVAIRECKASWRRLFPTYPPHTGDQASDFVSADYILV